MTETKEVQEFKGTLESVNKAETGQGKPFLKIKAVPEGLDKAGTYNYHAPYGMKDDAEKAAAHIEETRRGLLPQIDSDISFKYKEKPSSDPKYKPWKNITEFPAEFKAATKTEKVKGEDKGKGETVNGKDTHEPASRRPSDRQQEIGVVNGGPLFGRGEQSGGVLINRDIGEDNDRPEIPVPEKVKAREKEIAEAHEVDMVKKKVGWRLKRIAHMTECLEDAEKAWTEWFFGLVVAKEDLTPADLDNIRAIANGFMAEDGRKGRG